jgi:uncharacterized membrane protein
MIVGALKHPATIDNLRTLQTGAFMLIMDAYDRKATRDMMITALSAATNLLTELGKLYMIEHVRNAADTIGGVSPTQIEDARQGLIKQIHQTTRDAIAMADLLKQCPNDEDKVN